MANQRHSGDQQPPASCQPPPAAGGKWTASDAAVGILGGAVIGALWAWWAESSQHYLAPLILFPLLIGAGVGVTMVALTRITHIGHRPTIVACVVAAALIAAVGQHYVAYVSAYYWHRPPITDPTVEPAVSVATDGLVPSFGDYLEAQVRRGRPLFMDYVAQGWMVWLTWAIDGLLTLASAVAVTLLALQTSYCDRCRSWYRVTRNGKIDIPTAQQLAELADVILPENTRSRRYRLLNCQGGCGPTCCDLSWEDAHGCVSLVQFWLTPDGRRQVAEILDPVATETDNDE